MRMANVVRLRAKPNRRRPAHSALSRMVLATVLLTPPGTQLHAQESVQQIIEMRAECLTSEGGDMPVGGSLPPGPPNEQCKGDYIDGKHCGKLDGAAEKACLAKDIVIWDGVLDRLVKLSKGSAKREAPIRNAIAAFRKYRDTSCATFAAIAINTPAPNMVATCRVTETSRFAQALYPWFYSP